MHPSHPSSIPEENFEPDQHLNLTVPAVASPGIREVGSGDYLIVTFILDAERY
jgi:hypothetical protein